MDDIEAAPTAEQVDQQAAIMDAVLSRIDPDAAMTDWVRPVGPGG